MNNEEDSNPKFDDDQLMLNAAELHASYLLQTAQRYAE